MVSAYLLLLAEHHPSILCYHLLTQRPAMLKFNPSYAASYGLAGILAVAWPLNTSGFSLLMVFVFAPVLILLPIFCELLSQGAIDRLKPACAHAMAALAVNVSMAVAVYCYDPANQNFHSLASNDRTVFMLEAASRLLILALVWAWLGWRLRQLSQHQP